MSVELKGRRPNPHLVDGEGVPGGGEITIWTIGYSGRSKRSFLALLKDYGIEILVDVRHFPTSKNPDFRREALERWLPEEGVEYVWLGDLLGGYRRGGYERYMGTPAFRDGIEKLLELARRGRTCIMCMERNPKYCHRRFIAAYLEAMGVRVIHIIRRRSSRLTEHMGEGAERALR